jgi:DNA replication protein DnaC
MILRDEIELRLQRKLVYLTRRAGITNDKTLENFDFSFNPSVNAVLIRELSMCRFIEQGMNIFFFGPAGVGKTHLVPKEWLRH